MTRKRPRSSRLFEEEEAEEEEEGRTSRQCSTFGGVFQRRMHCMLGGHGTRGVDSVRARVPVPQMLAAAANLSDVPS
jgi:hypothetical protein